MARKRKESVESVQLSMIACPVERMITTIMFRKKRISLIPWFLVLLSLQHVPLHAEQGSESASKNQDDCPVVHLVPDYTFQQAEIANIPPPTSFKKLNLSMPLRNPAEGSRFPQALWLRLNLPRDYACPDAALFFFPLFHVKIIDASGTVRKSGPGASENMLPEPSFPKEMIFEPEKGTRLLYLKFYSAFLIIGPVKTVFYGPYLKIFMSLLGESLTIIFAVFASITAAIAVLPAIFHHRSTGRKIYTAFFIFAFFTGIWYASGIPVIHLSHPGISFFYLELFAQWFWPVGLFWLVELMIGAGPYKSIVFFKWMNLVLAILIPILVNVLFRLHMASVFFHLNTAYMILLGIETTILMMFHIYRMRNGAPIHPIINIAFLLLAIFGVREILATLNFIPREHDYYHIGVVLFVLMMGYAGHSLVRDMERNLLATSRDLMERETELGMANRKLLQERMNPHFLLNSFNLVYALITRDRTHEAEKAILHLSDHYRYLTDHSFDALVPFSQELEFAEGFAELQRMRSGSEFHYARNISRSVESLLDQILIPPLTLQPLVENCFRHGLAPPGGGTVNLSIELTNASQVQEKTELSNVNIVIRLEDDGAGLAADADLTGRSLGNIQKRVRFHYPTSTLLVENRAEGSGTLTTLEIKNLEIQLPKVPFTQEDTV